MWLSLLGFVAADAFAAWKLMGNKESELEFMKKLCFELIHNEEGLLADGVGRKRKRTKARRDGGCNSVGEGNAEEEDGAVVYPHLIRPVRELWEEEDGSSAHQLKCRMCHKECSVYCVMCSDLNADMFWGLCCPSTGRDCMTKHMYK